MAFILVVILSVYGQISYTQMGNDWNGLCRTGNEQSPININDLEVIELLSSESKNVSLNITQIIKGYFSTDLSFNVKLETDYGEVTINTEKFKLLNIHFHAPSEHHINGLEYDLELHLLGKNSTTSSANSSTNSSTNSSSYQVIGVLFNVGKNSNQFIQNVIDSYNTLNKSSFNMSWILPLVNLKSYYTYNGSATGPIVNNDCVEGVKWNLLDTPIEISKDQLKFFTDKWAGNFSFAGGNGNNRAIQKLKNRKVFHILNVQSCSLLTAVNLIALIIAF